MAGRLSKFLSLDNHRKRLLVSAFFALGASRFDLKRKSINELVSGLERLDGSTRTPDNNGQNPLAVDIGWAVRTAAGHTPWESTCLVQVLAAQRMLQSRNIAGEFYLGATIGEESLGVGNLGFRAHAWLTCGGQFITGESGHENYRVLARFRWG